jgi:hypothetical protein
VLPFAGTIFQFKFIIVVGPVIICNYEVIYCKVSKCYVRVRSGFISLRTVSSVRTCLSSFSSSDPSLNYITIRKVKLLQAENNVAANRNIVLYVTGRGYLL